MKTNIQLTPKITPKTKLKRTLVYTSAGVALALIIGIGAFFYFNIGDVEDAYAANYSSNNTGNWVDGSTWSGSAPGTSLNQDDVNINSGNEVTRNGSLSINNGVTFNINSSGILIITGDLTVNNNLQLNVNGTLIIQGNLTTNNGATLNINGGGDMTVEGSSTFNQNSTLNVSGDITFEGPTQFGDNTTVNINSGGQLTTSDDLAFGKNADISNNGSMDIGNDLTFADTPNQFDGSGDVNIGGTGCGYWNGSGGCTENTTLPVELLSFNAQVSGGEVIITWETATELNNDYFNIQRSQDGKTFKNITEITGNGTTNKVSSYSYVDGQPLNGIAYYRLKQTDFDGTTEIFRPVMVEMELTNNEIEVYPNPLMGENLNIRRAMPEVGDVNIFDYKGEKVYSEKVNGFDNVVALNIDQRLKPGLYYVKYQSGSIEKTVKLIKR